MKKFVQSLVSNPLLLRVLSKISSRPGLRRRIVSYSNLQGNGLEIGALHNPLSVSSSARVRYIDRIDPEGLKNHYRLQKSDHTVPLDIIDNAETLASVLSGSQDFVIANHVLEHMENPLLALNNWLRVIHNDGILFLAVPNKDKTFDIRRPVTTIDHLLSDMKDGPQVSRLQHYREWVMLVGNKTGVEADKRARNLMQSGQNIHFHVWDPPALLELMVYCRSRLNMPIKLELFEVQGNEVLIIIRKITAHDGNQDKS